MRKILMLLFAAVTTMSASAQTEKEIIGKWEYESVEKFDGDAEERELMESLLTDFSIQFDENHTGGLTIMGRTLVGNWKYEAATKTIELNTNDGKEKKFKVLKASANALTVSQKEDYTLNLKRGEPETLAAPVIPATKAVTKQQLPGKWELHEFQMAGQSIPASQIGGGFMKFEANGNYSSQVMGMDESGKWEIVEKDGAHQLKTSVKTKTTFFYLIDCTDALLTIAITGKDGTMTLKKAKS